MNRHASMNRVYRLIWSQLRSAWIPVAETARGLGKSGRAISIANPTGLAVAISLSLSPLAYAGPPVPPCVVPTCGAPAVSSTSHPMAGRVVSGSGRITQVGNSTEIRQSSPDLSIDWLSFNIGSQESVNFLQPSAFAVAVNRILGSNGTQILGRLDANGQVYLINPNGVIFGKGAEVNVGGLVASTLDVRDSDLSANTRFFAGSGTGSVINEGAINAANGGYVALVGNHVSNEGVITARLGTAALGAGSAVTMDFSGNRLVHLQVDQSTLNNLAANNQLIQADGGLVIMTAGAKNALLASVVNNSGVIEARTVENHNGTIELLGGMTAGIVDVAGILDASAPTGGSGGFIETNAAHVEVANNAKITTEAPQGLTGTWLIDPTDFTVAPTAGDISGATLSSNLNSTNFTILSSSGASQVTGGGSGGNINVNDAVSWNANTTLTLIAANNVNVNGNISASGPTAGLAINPNTANGSEAASGAGTLNLGAGASMTLSGASAALSISTSSYTLGTGASINLPNVSPTSITALVIGGTPYTVLNTLGAAGSTAGTNLQGINGNLSGYYALGSNIDATPTVSWNAGAGFAPIGNGANNFTGTFDGLGHTISNLTIRRSSSSNDVGLFGIVGSTGTVRSVGLVGGSVSGEYMVGALVGWNYGTISNSYATGNASGLAFVGGLVGYNEGAVSNAYATGSVSGSSSVGGLVGGNAYGSSLSNSYATGGVNVGSIGGGLVGYNDGTVTNTYSSGQVTGSGNLGGLIGENTFTVSNSYSTGQVTGSYSVGGLAGVNTGTITASYWDVTTSGQSASAGGTGMSTANMQYELNFTSATSANGNVNPNWSFANTWVMYNGYTYPLLRSFMAPLTVTANNASATYSNTAYSGGNGVTYTTPPNANLMGSLTYGGSSQGAVNAGSYTITPGGLFSNQQGYIISYANATLTVNPAILTLVGTRDYDGTTIVAGGTLTAVGVAGQTFSIAGAGDPSNLNSKNVQTNGNLATITGLNLGDSSDGGLASNYYPLSTLGSSITITPLALTGASIGAGNSIYGSAVTPGAVSFGNVIAGDVVGASASIVSPSYSTSNLLNAGGYAQTAGALSGADAGDYSFTGYTTPTANYTVGQLALTGASIGAGNSIYGSAVTPGAVSFGNVIAGDVVGASASIMSPSYSTSNHLNAGSYAQTAGALSGADAGDYSFTGYTTPTANYTVAQLALTVTGVTATSRVYNGSTADALGGTPSIAPLGGDLAGLSGGGSGSFADPNVANGKPVSVSGYTLSGADAGNYTLVEPSGLTANITPLATVAWVGGSSGNWSNPANWGGAIPDNGNVLSVTIPKGTTVTYDAGMAGLGTTILQSLTSGGTVVMAAGALDTTGTLSTASFEQTGGALTAGIVKITNGAHGVSLGDLTAGTLSVTSTGGAITELGGTSIDVTGTASLVARNAYGIALPNSGNDFSGAITASGMNIDLESGTGDLTLGTTTAAGTLTLTALAGSIAQAKGKKIDVAGLVTADGGAITLNSSVALTADVTSTGAVSLTAAGSLDVSGSIGTNLTTVTTGGGSTTFGNAAVGTQLAVRSSGAISQEAVTSLVVKGASSLNAGGASAIILTNTGDTFAGKVTASGDDIWLYDTRALTAVLNSSGNASVQSAATIAKALTVSGTIAGSLTTTSAGGTVFGNTIVDPSSPTGTPVLLNITNPGALSVIAGDTVTVGGTPVSLTVTNPYVELNGVQDTQL